MFGLSVNTDVRDDDTPSAWRSLDPSGPAGGIASAKSPSR